MKPGENRQLIQCELVITKTNSKPWHPATGSVGVGDALEE